MTTDKPLVYCTSCGEIGHWAARCPNKHKIAGLVPARKLTAPADRARRPSTEQDVSLHDLTEANARLLSENEALLSENGKLMAQLSEVKESTDCPSCAVRKAKNREYVNKHRQKGG